MHQKSGARLDQGRANLARRITPYLILVLATQARQAWAPVRRIEIQEALPRPAPTGPNPSGTAQQRRMDRHSVGSQESPEVVGRQNDVALFQSLLTTLPSINQLVNHLGCLVSQPVSRPISVVIDSAKKELARRLEFCLHSLGRRVMGRPLEEITNLPRHRSGRKKGQNKEEHDELLRMTVLGLVRDAHNRSIYSYLSDNQLLNLRTSLERFVNSDTRLKYIVTGNRRADPALRREAVDIVRRRLVGVEEEGDVEDKTRSI